jgi:hypothetical protein
MFTGFENVPSDAAVGANADDLTALLADLASDPADLLDVAALRGVAFQKVVTDLLETRGRSADERRARLVTIGRFGTSSPFRSAGPPRPEPPPFVWVRVLRPRGVQTTVRAGWLTAEALDVVVTDARAAGPGSRLEVIVPLDSGTAAVERVQALCRTVTGDDLAVSVQAQSEPRVGEARRGSVQGYRATWVAFAPVGARP